MSKPRVSVAIPTLGREQVMLDTIKEVLRQDFDGFELVVVDQTSKHELATETALKAIKDPRFHYYRVTPASLTAARNFAIYHAAADIILFLDDDVILDPGFIQKHYDAFQKDSQIVAVAGRVINKTNTQELTKVPLLFDRYARGRSTFNCDVSQYGHSLPGGNMSMLRTAIIEAGLFDPSFQKSAVREESDAAYRLNRIGKIYFSAEASILHLAAPYGGTRVTGHPYDSQSFYNNDLLFALKAVRPFWLIPLSLAARLRDVIREQPLDIALRRTRLYFAGLLVAIKLRLHPLKIEQTEVDWK